MHVDYETQKRTVKNSGQFYCALIAEGGVDDSLYEEYVAGQTYPKAGEGLYRGTETEM